MQPYIPITALRHAASGWPAMTRQKRQYVLARAAHCRLGIDRAAFLGPQHRIALGHLSGQLGKARKRIMLAKRPHFFHLTLKDHMSWHKHVVQHQP